MRLKKAILVLLFLSITGCKYKGKDMDNTVAADIGAIQNFSRIKPNLAVSGQPTEANLKKASESGYKTIINLRPKEEWPFDEKSLVEDLGMKYVLIPIANPDELTIDKAKELGAILDDTSAYPILLHCGSSNRVGALYALQEYLKTKETEDKIIELGKEAGMTSPALEERIRIIIK
jgi:uncharacterized protein (TIGR01244 family)